MFAELILQKPGAYFRKMEKTLTRPKSLCDDVFPAEIIKKLPKKYKT